MSAIRHIGEAAVTTTPPCSSTGSPQNGHEAACGPLGAGPATSLYPAGTVPFRIAANAPARRLYGVPFYLPSGDRNRMSGLVLTGVARTGTGVGRSRRQ